MDIARALSMTCRYTGHVPRFYSVAEHSVLVSDQLDSLWAGERLVALLHDAAEAYLHDLPTPIKDVMPGYQEAEEDALVAIAEALGLVITPELGLRVREVDKRVFELEQAAFGGEYNCVRFLTPPEAEQVFLERFGLLRTLRSFE